MNYIILTYTNHYINEIELPEEIIKSLEIRGKRSQNHRFDEANCLV